MNIRSKGFLGVSLIAPLLNATSLLAQSAVPVHQEPRHRLAFEGMGFRVLDVQIPRGDTTRYHVHDTPILYVAISTTATDFQLIGGAWGGTKPGSDPDWAPGDTDMDTTYAAKPVTHRVTNVGREPFRLIGVTTARRGTKGDAPAVTLEAPGTPELSSTWFRQTRLQLPAQTVTAWHTSSAPVVIVQPLEGEVAVEMAEGGQLLTMPGAFATLPAGKRYRIRNAGKTVVTIIVVQVR